MIQNLKTRNLDEYLVCNRKAGPALVAFSILASCIGGSATIGMAGLAWQCGTPAFWWLGAGVAGLICLGLFVAKKVRRTKAKTMPEVIKLYLGKHCAYLAALLVLFSNLAIIAAQFKAMGIMFSSLINIPVSGSIIAGAAVLLAYTLVGGQWTVMKSDVWQFIVLLFSLLLAFFFLIQNQNCLEALKNAPIEAWNDSFPFSRVRYFLIILGGSFVIGPMLFGRILSARSENSAVYGSLWAALGLAFMAVLITATGIALQGVNMPEIPAQDVFSYGIKSALPGWVSIVVTVGLLSAVVSSADSCLLTAASVGSNDLGSSGNILKVRIWLILIACGSCLLALFGKGIIALLLMANDIYVSGVVAPVFICLMARPKAEHNRICFFIAMLSGGFMGLCANILEQPDYALWGFFISFCVSMLAVLPWGKVCKFASTD